MQGLVTFEQTEYGKWIKELYEKFLPYASKDFEKQFKAAYRGPDHQNLEARIWEMLMASKLLEAGFNLGKNSSNAAPDLWFEHGNQKVWVECCLPQRGEYLDEVREKSRSELTEDPPENHALRITSALNEKMNQWKSRLDKNASLIIALNGKNIKQDISNDQLPEIMQVLYGFEPVTRFRKYTGVENTFSPRDAIVKNSGKKVDSKFFKSCPKNIIGVFLSNEWPGVCRSGDNPKNAYVENISAENRPSLDFSKIAQTYNYDKDQISLK